LIESAGELDLTFHRAFDMSRNLDEALEDIHALGIRRVLTSGGQPDVPTGMDRIRSLVNHADGRVSLMPGGGVTETNLENIVRRTGVQEIHLSARDTVHSLMQHRNNDCYMGTFSKDREYEWREASVEKIRQAKAALSRALSSAAATR
jgi:copper homeostasis protein